MGRVKIVEVGTVLSIIGSLLAGFAPVAAVASSALSRIFHMVFFQTKKLLHEAKNVPRGSCEEVALS